MTERRTVVVSNRDATTVSVSSDETILEACEAAGMTLPFACRYGGCVTCAARLISGEVDQPEAVGLKRYMREADYVLTCVAHPRTDCEIEVGVESHFKGLYRNPFRGSSVTRPEPASDPDAPSPYTAPHE